MASVAFVTSQLVLPHLICRMLPFKDHIEPHWRTHFFRMITLALTFTLTGTNVQRTGKAPTVVVPPPPFATALQAGVRVCFTLGNKRVILSLNLACSNLYGGREAVGVKPAQLFFIPLHFFHLSPAFRSLGKRFFLLLLFFLRCRG